MPRSISRLRSCSSTKLTHCDWSGGISEFVKRRWLVRLSAKVDGVENAAAYALLPQSVIDPDAKATDIYLGALSSIPLYHPNWFFAARKSVGGVVMVPDGLLRLTGVKPAN